MIIEIESAIVVDPENERAGDYLQKVVGTFSNASLDWRAYADIKHQVI